MTKKKGKPFRPRSVESLARKRSPGLDGTYSAPALAIAGDPVPTIGQPEAMA